MLTVITLRKASFIPAKQQGTYFTLKKESMTCDNRNLVYWSFTLHLLKSTLDRLEKEKLVQDRARFYEQRIHQQQYQQLKCECHFRVCGKEKLKYSFSSNYVQTINTSENCIRNIFVVNQHYTSNHK